MKYRDLKAVVDTSYEDGEQIGFEKGEKAGFEKGKYERDREIAKTMKIKGYPIEDISDLTQLPTEEIEKL